MIPVLPVSLLCLCLSIGANAQYFYSAPNYYNPIPYQQPYYSPIPYQPSLFTLPQPIYNQQFPKSYNDPSSNVPSNFRGFAYHMENDNGARSNVIFLTGKEIHQMKVNPVVKTRTSASDAVDSIAKDVEVFNANGLDALVDYLRHPQMGVQNFYYVNDALVMRSPSDDIPADKPRALAPVIDSPIVPLLRSAFNLESGTPEVADVSEESTTVTSSETSTEEKDNTAASEQDVKTVAPDVTSTTTLAATEKTSEAEVSTTMETIAVEEATTMKA